MALIVVIVIAIGLAGGIVAYLSKPEARRALHQDLAKDPIGLPAGLLSCALLVVTSVAVFVHPIGNIHIPLGQSHVDLWQACLAGSIVSLVVAINARPKMPQSKAQQRAALIEKRAKETFERERAKPHQVWEGVFIERQERFANTPEPISSQEKLAYIKRAEAELIAEGAIDPA